MGYVWEKSQVATMLSYVIRQVLEAPYTPWNNKNVRLFGVRISILRNYLGGVRIPNFFFPDRFISGRLPSRKPGLPSRKLKITESETETTKSETDWSRKLKITESETPGLPSRKLRNYRVGN